MEKLIVALVMVEYSVLRKRSFLVSGIFVSPLLFAQLAKLTGTVQGGFIVMGSVCAVSALLIPMLIRATMPAHIVAPVDAMKKTGATG